MIKNVQRLIAGYSNPFHIVLIFIVLAGLDVLGISAVPLLIEVAMGGRKDTFDVSFLSAGEDQVVLLSGFILFLFFLKFSIFILANFMVHKFSYGVMHHNRSELISLLVNTKYQSVYNKSAAEFINLLQLHINQSVSNYLIPALKIASDIIVAFFILSYLIAVHTKVSLVLIISTITVGIIYLLGTRKFIYSYGRTSYESNLSMIDLSKSIREGFVDITINDGVAYFHKMFNGKSLIFSDVQMKSATIRSIPRPLFELVIIVFVVGIVLLNSRDIDAIEQLGLFATFGLGALRLLPALTSVIASLSLMKNTEAALQKYFMEKDNLVASQLLVNPNVILSSSNKPIVKSEVSNITVNDLQFRHDDAKPLIESVSLIFSKVEQLV